MNNLNIDQASIGYDVGGLNAAYDGIRVKLIEDAANVLKNKAPTFLNSIDNYWKGSSADVFKEKFERDTESVINTLYILADSLKQELNQKDIDKLCLQNFLYKVYLLRDHDYLTKNKQRFLFL